MGEVLDAARYGKHKVYNSLVRAKMEGNLTDELRRSIINTRKFLNPEEKEN